ncbi:hypothetical protein ACVWZK_008484 [Bradyrhizobium sp. GM0.4]
MSDFFLRWVFYTAPSRLISHQLRMRLYDEYLDVFVMRALITLLRERSRANTTASSVIGKWSNYL